MTADSEIDARLVAMNDLEIVRFFEHWATGLCDGAVTDLSSITAGVPKTVQAVPGFAEATDVSSDESFDPATSAELARSVLLPLASDSQFSTTIAMAMETFEDDRLFVDVILAAGLVASVLLIVSTTEFDGKIGAFAFHKGKVDPDTIKAVLEGVFAVLKP